MFFDKNTYHLFCKIIYLFYILLLLTLFLNGQGGDASVNSVHLFSKSSDHIIVCNKTSSIYLMTLQGQVTVPILYKLGKSIVLCHHVDVVQ